MEPADYSETLWCIYPAEGHHVLFISPHSCGGAPRPSSLCHTPLNHSPWRGRQHTLQNFSIYLLEYTESHSRGTNVQMMEIQMHVYRKQSQ
jgi:hypothetical protein